MECQRPAATAPGAARRDGRKVFGIGMFKTGTTTFGRAMQILGFRADWRYWPVVPGLAPYFDLDTQKFAPFQDQIRRQSEAFDCLADAPWLFLYEELARWHPESLFVLTLRKNALTLAESDLAMWRRVGLTERWLQEVGTAPTVAMFVERYERHNEAVARFFADKPGRMLPICWETEPDPWARLCAFVGAAVPAERFPHENRRPAGGPARG